MFLRNLLSLIIGAASTYGFYDFIYPKRFLAFLIGILVFYISRKIMKAAAAGKSTTETAGDAFLNIKKEKAVREGVEKLRNIRNSTRMISDNQTALKVQSICKTGLEIFDYIEKNPEDLKKAKQFINYYLDTTEKIVKQYVELSSRKEKSTEVTESLSKVEALLDSIDDTYRKQLHNLLEDDLLDLNVEIEVLEKTMRLEG